MPLIFELIAKYDELFDVLRKDGRLRLWVSGCQTGLQREPSASQPSFSAVWTDAQRSRLSHGLEAVLPRSPHDNLLGHRWLNRVSTIESVSAETIMSRQRSRREKRTNGANAGGEKGRISIHAKRPRIRSRSGKREVRPRLRVRRAPAGQTGAITHRKNS